MSGITRSELLILLFIGGVLAAIGVPWVESAREAARRSSCRNNLKQVGLALENYHDVWKSFPLGCVGNPEFKPSRRWSWFIGLKPYLGVQKRCQEPFLIAAQDVERGRAQKRFLTPFLLPR